MPRRDHLLRGATRSCGCTSLTHGMTGSAEHRIWVQMRYRCSAPASADFDRYGGRGIKVDPRWDSFEAFIADVGPRPSRRHTLDRIDNDGDYAPENCRWATNREQSRNKRTSSVLVFNGRRQTVTDWAEELGISRSTIYMRLASGWSTTRALSEPVNIEKASRGSNAG